jgi:hypothetical protein
MGNRFILQGTAGQEVEAGQDLSALVNYVEPIRFQTFEKHDSEQQFALDTVPE